MDRFSKQNISKDIVSLNNALDEMDLTDYIYIYGERKRRTQLQKIGKNKYLSIITLNVNGLNAPIKDIE